MTHNWKGGLAAALFAVTAMPAVRAQDASVELTVGGLIFVPNEDVEIRSAEYFVSATEVRIRYRLFNGGGKDIHSLISLPLPEIRVDDNDTQLAIPTDDPSNAFGVEVQVNGQKLQPQLEQRAMVAGIDRAPLLKSLGLPLAPHLPATNAALNKLPAEKWDELVGLGLVEMEEDGKGNAKPAKHLTARWGLQAAYHWMQSYKSQAETIVELKYKPSLGAAEGTTIGIAATTDDEKGEAVAAKYCVGPELTAAVSKVRKAAKLQEPPFDERRIELGLLNGANYSIVIGDFRLVVDKGKAENFVAFCGDRIRTISPTEVEMRKTDFAPDESLSILILQKQAN